MIKAISMLGNVEAPANVANAAPAVKPEVNAPALNQEPVKDTFVPSADKKEETPKADPNDKFEKADKKTEETK